MRRVSLPVVGKPTASSAGCGTACPPSCSCPSVFAPPPRAGGVSRRRFLVGAGAAATGAIAGAGLGPGLASIARASGAHDDVMPPSKLKTDYAPPPIPGVQFGMAIDLKKCIGCRKCAYACRLENNVGRDSNFLLIELHRMERGSQELEHSEVYYTEAADPKYWYFPIGCMQCENPPCVQACPVQATWREPDGIVLVDYRKCIGCRYCMVNCPYGARHFNWKRPTVPAAERNPAVPMRPLGVVEKCTFCVHRTRKGKLPACVEACPVGARVFGNVADPKSPVSQLIASRTPFRLKEHLGTRPRVFYVG